MMKARNVLLLSAIAASVFIPLKSASAMTAKQGFGQCDKNPKCRADVQANGDVIFTDGSFVVYCPQEGNCSIIVDRGSGKKPKIVRPAVPKDLAVKAH